MASANVRDALGWGTSDVIARSICGVVRDSLGYARYVSPSGFYTSFRKGSCSFPCLGRQYGGLQRLVVTTSLMHRERLAHGPRVGRILRYASVRLARAVFDIPLIHPLNNRTCYVRSYARLLCCRILNTSRAKTSTFPLVLVLAASHACSRVESQLVQRIGSNSPLSNRPLNGLWRSLERRCTRRYEPRQLKCANEGACVKSGTRAGSSSSSVRLPRPPLYLIVRQPRLSQTNALCASDVFTPLTISLSSLTGLRSLAQTDTRVLSNNRGAPRLVRWFDFRANDVPRNMYDAFAQIKMGGRRQCGKYTRMLLPPLPIPRFLYSILFPGVFSLLRCLLSAHISLSSLHAHHLRW